MDTMTGPKSKFQASVIIPTLNRAHSLSQTLQSLSRQALPPEAFEILVIDNGSLDSTASVVQNAVEKFAPHIIRYIYEPVPGSLSGRHRGALEAKSDILVFIDDDIAADSGWLDAIIGSFADSTLQIVGGKNLPYYEVIPPEWLEWFWYKFGEGRACSELSLLDFGEETREIDPIWVWSLNLAIRKQALFALGGFHPDIFPKHLQHFQGDGEVGLTMKAKERGFKALYQPKALIYHRVPGERMTFEYFDNRYFFEGVCHSFTDIRRLYKKYKAMTFLDKVKSYLRPMKLAAKSILDLPGSPHVANIFRKLKLRHRFQQSFLAGYNFHQLAVQNNPPLLEWVLRENYWDYRLPEFDKENSL